MALWWRWEIWASQEGIACFNYSLKKFFRPSPMCDMQMTHREHVPKPSGGAADVEGWHCGGRPADVRCIWARGHLGDFSDALAMFRSLGDGCKTGGRWHRGSTAMFILSGSGCSVTPLPSSNVCGRRYAIAGWNLCQWSVRISEYKGLEFLGYS